MPQAKDLISNSSLLRLLGNRKDVSQARGPVYQLTCQTTDGTRHEQ